MAIASLYPTIKPSLLLDFANSKKLDPRVTFTRSTTATYYDGVTTAKAEENLLLNSVQPINTGWQIERGYAGTLGSELVTNGDFASSTGWTLDNGWSIGGGVATANTTLGSERLTSTWSGQNNKSYLVTATITMLATPNINAQVSINIGGPGQNVPVLSQDSLVSGSTYTINAVGRPTSVSGAFAVAINSNLNYAMNYTIDDVSIKELTADNVTAPDGTATAVTLTAGEANATFTQSVTAIAAEYTFSVYLRRVTGTGDIDIQCGGGTWVTQTITSSWARYTVTQTLTAGSRTPGIRIVTSGDQIEVWGAQLEQRSAATAYTPTTTQPITNYVPQLLTAPAGVPRFDHNPTTGESLGLLVEEQRTNLQISSEDISGSVYRLAVTTTANAAIAPNGTLTADLLTSSVSDAGSDIYPTDYGSSSGQTQTFSMFVKQPATDGAASIVLDLALTGSRFTFSGGSVVISQYNFPPTGTAVATAVGNGWWRISVTTNKTNVFHYWNFRIPVGSLLVWGVQLENGAFPTSYIPTTSASVTRTADAPSMTGANFSSWYRQDEGSWLFDYRWAGGTAGNYAFTIGSNTTDQFYVYADGAKQLTVITNNVLQVNNLSAGTFLSNAYNRVSFAYKANDFAVSLNASAVATDTSGLVPFANKLQIGSSGYGVAFPSNNHYRRLAYYPARLTNAQLQALTA